MQKSGDIDEEISGGKHNNRVVFMDKQEACCSVEEDGYNEKINEEIKRTLMRRDETGI